MSLPDELRIPEHRFRWPWRRRQSRRVIEGAAGAEAEAFLAALGATGAAPPEDRRGKHRRPGPIRVELPCMQGAPRMPAEDEILPWDTAEPPAPAAQLPALPALTASADISRKRPGDPPTIVMMVIRPALAEDLEPYLASLPRYSDE